MNKVKKRRVILTLGLIASLLFFWQSVVKLYAYSNENEEWNVKITSNTKDITSKNTEDIKFEIQDNPNVKKGCIAPGVTAIATFYLDLTKTKYEVDFKMDITEEIPSNFDLTATIDGENYTIGDIVTFNLNDKNEFDEENGKKEIVLVLKWNNEETDSKSDTSIGTNSDYLSIPISWEAKQHIK